MHNTTNKQIGVIKYSVVKINNIFKPTSTNMQTHIRYDLITTYHTAWPLTSIIPCITYDK